MAGNSADEKMPILGKGRRDGTCCSWFPARYALAVLGFFGFFNVYAMRVNLSVAMVAMVNDSASQSGGSHGGHHAETACLELLPDHGVQLNSSSEYAYEEKQGVFNWDPTTQSIILGSFFYGYVVTQIPGGVLAEKCGARWLFGIGVLVTSVFTILTPLAAHVGVTALILVRVTEGLAEGVTFPAVNSLIGRWAPKMERSRMSTIIFTGSPVGTVLAMSVSGLLADANILGGWPAIFYVFGLIGCIWFLFWACLVYEKPTDHPRISKAELLYIQQNQDELSRKPPPVPWGSILTSVPVWALAVAHFGHNWGFYTLLTEMPTYLANVLHFDIKKNGTLSSFPYILHAVFAWLASYVADRLRQNNWFTITTIRKIMNSIAFFGPGVCVLCVAFMGCRPVLIVTLLCVALGLNGFIYSGFNVTHVDMSPDYAGTLMGITNCIANLSGFLAPYVVGRITSQGQTLHNWGLVFAISSAVYFFTGLMFNIFCSAELQPWGLGGDRKEQRISGSSTTSTDGFQGESQKPALHFSPSSTVDLLTPNASK